MGYGFMGTVEEFACKDCGQVFEAEVGGGFLFFLFRCPSCGTTHVMRKGRTDAEKSIDFKALVCDPVEDPPLCPQCNIEMKTGIPPLCPQCGSGSLRYLKTVLSYD